MTDPNEGEYRRFVASLPRGWEQDLMSDTVATAYWEARRAGHDAESVRAVAVQASSKGRNVGGIVVLLRQMSSRSPIGRAGGSALPLPECQSCAQPYRRTVEVNQGTTCVSCGERLVLIQHTSAL